MDASCACVADVRHSMAATILSQIGSRILMDLACRIRTRRSPRWHATSHHYPWALAGADQWSHTSLNRIVRFSSTLVQAAPPVSDHPCDVSPIKSRRKLGLWISDEGPTSHGSEHEARLPLAAAPSQNWQLAAAAIDEFDEHGLKKSQHTLVSPALIRTSILPRNLRAHADNMPVSAEKVAIRHRTSDDFPLAVTIFRPTSSADVKASVVFANATGVQARFYHNVAAWLSQNGVAAYTFDYRFSGASFPLECDPAKLAEDEDYFEEALRRCPDHVDLTTTWCKVDLASIVRLAYESNPEADVTVIGHSLGGHLMAVLPADHVYGPRAKVKRLLNVCGGNAYVKNQKEPDAAEFGFTEIVVKPLAEEKIFRAANLGLGYDLPYGPGLEWVQWYFHPHFAFNRPENMKLARGLKGVPLLYVGFEDDDKIGKNMMEKYLGMFDHSDGLKQSLWIDPVKKGWPSCGHVNAFTKSKEPKLVPVEHGEAYTSQKDFEDAISSQPKPSRPSLSKEETIWRLFLDYILGNPVDTSHAEYKVWTRQDEREIEKERREDAESRRKSPRKEDIILGFVSPSQAKL
ncbi:FOG: Reverse transcriptase [Moesziomyces antarcticus T-34]|uniref:FOG: Reverse transcriptase n=1 Tax=Pseudozyma antarctica (strain T-34) TaxID=1151754 RepID=M9M9Y0_PSEA3|nr:FOG: Reverse transcriptase [Moesziomyces antarcticus T-34]